jgi:hypothetical protein
LTGLTMMTTSSSSRRPVAAAARSSSSAAVAARSQHSQHPPPEHGGRRRGGGGGGGGSAGGCEPPPPAAAAAHGGGGGGAGAGLALRALLQIAPETALRSDDGPDGWLARVNRALAANRLPPLAAGLNHNGIPNRRFPSDHLPIMAVFEFV